MIKLDLTPKPERLTDELVKEKTLEYKTDHTKSVWNIPWLKEAIAGLAYGKCCYSEIRLREESKYMEVEHFFPKSRYPDHVMRWGNLLPACKTCNMLKGNHDTGLEPLVNPFIDNPKSYFYLENGLYCEKNDKGRLTWEKLGLNEEELVRPRNNVRELVITTLADLQHLIIQPSEVGYAIKRVKQLMQEGNRKEEYAALVSTTILTDANYQFIESFAKGKGLWDDTLKALKEELEFCSLIN
jgi:5-methylcytosine-specific restriction endonuclease McrA